MATPPLKYNPLNISCSGSPETQVSGFELKEVSFSEFDRRKTPRLFKQEVSFENASAHDSVLLCNG